MHRDGASPSARCPGLLRDFFFGAGKLYALWACRQAEEAGVVEQWDLGTVSTEAVPLQQSLLSPVQSTHANNVVQSTRSLLQTSDLGLPTF